MRTVVFIAICLLTLFLTTSFRGMAANPLQAKSIFIVLSYSRGDLCGDPQLKGILQAINEGPYRHLSIKKYYLDAKRLSPEEVENKTKKVLKAIEETHPKVVITVDDVAFLKVGLPLNGRKDTFIVFSGINGDISSYNNISRFLKGRNPTSNITGVLEHLFLKEQIDFLRLIKAGPCSLAILYSTDFMGEKGRDQIGKQLRKLGTGHTIRYFSVSDTKDLVLKAKEINQETEICAYIPLVLSIYDPVKKKRVTLDSMVPEITALIHKIDIAVNKTFTKAGFFGGANVDMFHMGYQAGQMAGMLLDGVEIARLPVEDAARFQIVVNKKRAQQLDITLDPDTLCLIDELI